jgi:hypothetical protein
VIPQDDVQHPIGSERDAMRAMLAHLALEFDNRSNILELPVTIFVGQSIERTSLRPISGYKYFAIERQNPLAVFHQRAVRFNLVQIAVLIGVIDQLQRTVFARNKQMAKLIERHGDQRAGLFTRD